MLNFLLINYIYYQFKNVMKSDLNINNNIDLQNQINQTPTNTNNEVIGNLKVNVIIPQINLNNNSKSTPLLELPDSNSVMSDDNDESYHSYESLSFKSITNHFEENYKTAKMQLSQKNQ